MDKKSAENSPFKKQKQTTRKLSSLVDEVEDPIYSEESPYFAAIFEYSQGSSPNVVWQHGIMTAADNNDFMTFVINTPVHFNESLHDSHPITIISAYQNIKYIAVYAQICDIEARGFIRSIVFVISNNSRDKIITIYYQHRKRMKELVSKLLKQPNERFVKDLENYAASLQNTINKSTNTATLPALASKMHELSSYLQEFGINSNTLDESVEVNEPEYFIRINNNLRPMASLTHIDRYAYFFEAFVCSLPQTLILNSISQRADIAEPVPSITFGYETSSENINSYQKVISSVFDSDYNKARFKLKDLVNCKVFYYCTFSVLSGRTLLIKSKHIGDANSLAKRFAMLSPFIRDNHIKVIDTITPFDCLKYAIVVTSNIGPGPKHFVSLLNLDNGVYSGAGCPPHSFVTTLGKSAELSEKAFLMNIYTIIQKLSANFMIKIAETSQLGPITEGKMRLSLQDAGFNFDDEPIFTYWIHSLLNKQKCHPVLMNNMPIGGQTSITF